MNDKRRVHVTKSEKNPETTEILADAIVRISESFKQLQKSGLNRHAIIVLVQDDCHIGKKNISVVLNSLNRLAGYYCKK